MRLDGGLSDGQPRCDLLVGVAAGDQLQDLDLAGLDLPESSLQQLLDLDRAAWHGEIDDIGRYLEEYGDRLPAALRAEYQRVKAALGKAELKQELAELDAKLDEVKAKAAAWADKADDQIDDIMDEAREKTSGWMKELKEEYQKLRDRFDRDERPTA